MRCRQSLAKIKNQLQLQSLGATGGVENITEGLSGLTLVSFFKVTVHEEFPSNIINESENFNAFSEFSLLDPFRA